MLTLHADRSSLESSSCVFNSLSLASGDSSGLSHYRTEILTVRLHILSTSG